MKTLFSTADNKTRRDWHYTLVQAEEGDAPYCVQEFPNGLRIRAGRHLLQVQRNRQGAPITYVRLTDEEGADLMRIAQTNRDAAEKYMERLSAL